jgi:hypothetical protein
VAIWRPSKPPSTDNSARPARSLPSVVSEKDSESSIQRAPLPSRERTVWFSEA